MSRIWMGHFLFLTLFFAALGCSTSPIREKSKVSSKEGSEEVDESSRPQPREIRKDEYDRLIKAIRSKSDDQVEEFAGELLGAKPEDPVVLNALAMHHWIKGRPKMAKLILSRAFERNKEGSGLHNNLALILLGEGEGVQALDEMKKALGQEADHRESHANLGSFYAHHQDFERARVHLGKAYRKYSSNLDVANNFAVSLRKVGDYSMSKDVYSKLVETQSENIPVLLNYATLLVENLRDAREGEKIIKRIKFLGPNAEQLGIVNELEGKLRAMREKK